MKNIYLRIPEIQSASSDLVLATVTGSIGSTPQKPGSSALFNHGGLITGTVGGGVVEGRVKEFAIRSTQTKKSGYLHLSLDKDISDKEEAICGGDISILVDASPYDHLPVFREIKKSLADRNPGVLITIVTEDKDGETVVKRHWMTKYNIPALPDKYFMKIEKEANGILSQDDPEAYSQFKLSDPGKEPSQLCLLEPIFPLPQLVIAGAGHIGKALSHLGKMLDFEVTVIDDRSEFANSDNLPDADHIFVADIGKAIHEIEKKPDTYIVIVTRGHKDDANALKPCIGSSAAYVGMIGSKGKVAKMHSEFIRRRWASEEQWNRIYTPVGLDIKSKTVEEIAVSIAAQIVLVKNSKR